MIIGLTGKAGVGKSEAARYLAERYGFRRTHTKAPIVEMAIPLLRRMGVPEEEIPRRIDGDLKEVPIPGFEPVTGRIVQQALGGEARDAIDPLLYMKIWWRENEGVDVVNESIRYANEIDFIHARGGLIVRICRPGFDGVNGHMSEQQSFSPDTFLWNNGPIEVLHRRLDGIVDRLRRAA
jgi:hypothetical protein